MSSLDDRPFPTIALMGAGLMLLVTVAGVGAAQLSKHFSGPAAPTLNVVAAQHSFRFVDLGDGVNAYGGHVRVFDATTGAELPQLRENDGFIRAVLNSLNFERVKRQLSAAPVFDLVRWRDNRLTLEDPVTHAQVNVGAFGNGNRAVFQRLFTEVGTKP